jgi:CheY-like chemotaxis protein
MIILIADDDRITRIMLCRQLQLLGHTVWEAENGQEALQLLKDKGEANIIFLDREMPVMDGLATMVHLRKNPVWQHIPVVMLTGADSTEKITQGLNAGVNYYLVKPFNSESIKSTLAHIQKPT